MPLKRRIEEERDPLALDQFRWRVCTGGYRFEERFFTEEELGEHGLTGDVLVPQSDAVREYVPLAVPKLFRDFGECRIRHDDIVRFADRYGLLGVEVWLNLCGVEDRIANSLSKSPRGEWVALWQNEILAMRTAIRVWDALSSGLVSPVQIWFVPGQRFPWQSGFPSSADSIPGDAVMCLPGADDDLGSFYHLTDIVAEDTPLRGPVLDSPEAAHRLLIRQINHRIRSHCAPYLEQWTSRPLSALLRVSPTNLLGALWWQFARAVTGEASYRQCKVCLQWIELSTGDHGFRIDREFCSNECKYKDHRAKVRKAKELKARGRTIGQIAKELGAKSKSVKKWLTKKK
jgi:hypothetical protein